MVCHLMLALKLLMLSCADIYYVATIDSSGVSYVTFKTKAVSVLYGTGHNGMSSYVSPTVF